MLEGGEIPAPFGHRAAREGLIDRELIVGEAGERRDDEAEVPRPVLAA